MNHYEKIVSDLSDTACKRVSRRVILSLAATTTGSVSGERSILRNVWDEICVQIQREPSIFWEDYLRLVDALTAKEAASLKPLEKQAVFLQTRDGSDWSIDNENDEDVPISDDEIAQYIVQEYVLLEADCWTNRRIERFLEMRGDTLQFTLPELSNASLLKGPAYEQPLGDRPPGKTSGTEVTGLPRWKQPLPSGKDLEPTQKEWDRAMAARDAELAAKAPRDKDGNLVMVVMPPNDL